MPISFPSSPVLNQQYTYSGHTWQYNGTVWQSVGTAQGVQGVQGIANQGVQGLAGTAAAQGLQGPQGLQGGGFNQLQGTTGIQGIQGISGTTILSSSNTFTSNNTITPSTSVTALTLNPAASSKGLIIKANATTPGNLTEWQDSSGNVLVSMSSDGYINKSGTVYIGPQLNFANPGVGADTRFTFTKSNDGAWLSVKERSADSTYYEFGMSDNALDGGDYFQWNMSQWAAPGYGWAPIQLGSNSGKNQTLRFIGEQSVFWSHLSTPENSAFYTYLGNNNASADYEVTKWTAANDTTIDVKRFESTGSTATLNVDLSGYTATSRIGYKITIDSGATTFSYTTYGDSSTGTAIAINSGNWVTLSNGVKIKLSAGALAGEYWSFLAFPTPRVGIGGAVDTSALAIIRPVAGDKGLIIKASASQTANLQEWQNSSNTVLSSINSSGSLELNGKDIELMTIMAAF